MQANTTTRWMFRMGLAVAVTGLALLTASAGLPVGAQSATAAATQAATAASPTQTASAHMRFVHALPGGGPVDVYIDGKLAASKLSYGQATDFLSVTLDSHAVTVVGSGQGASATPIVATNITPARGAADLLVVVNGTTDKPEASVIKQDLSPVAAGKARFTAVHAIKDAPAIDVLRPDGTPILAGLQYGTAFGGFDAPASAPGLAVVPAGGQVSSAILQIESLPLDAGTFNDLVVLGTVSGAVKPSYLLLSTATQSNAGDVLVRFVNGANPGKAVDLYVNGTLIAPDLEYGVATPHLAITGGSAKIELRNVGDKSTTTALGSQTVMLSSPAQTVVITSKAGAYAATTAVDQIAGLDAQTARVTLIDASGAGATFALTSQGATTSKPGGQSVDLPGGQYMLSAGGATASQTLNGGTLTDLILIGASDTAKLIVADTAISAQPGSAFDVNAASATPVATSAATVAAPTAAPAINATATTSAPIAASAKATSAATKPVGKTPKAVSPSPSPTITPTTGPTQPSAITATVATNPGVNLKIRQYPTANALTLVLVPSGSNLYVLGAIGPVATTGTPSPSSTSSITPTDLPGIWLFVSYATPDGNTVTGWTLSNFLSIEVNGTPIASDSVVKIRGIASVASNTPGQTTGSTVGNTPLTNVVTAKVTTAPGVNAQLRRTPDVLGESLALIPSGTILTVLGQTTSTATPIVGSPLTPTWYFVRYDVGGSSIFGWVSGDRLYLTYRGQAAPTGVVPTQATITRGYIQGNGVTQIAATAPAGLVATIANLSPGANVQVRAQPNVNATVIDKVQNGTILPALGRNGDGSWVQVQDQGQAGWVNSGFLFLTHSGSPVSIGLLRITNGDTDTFVQSATLRALGTTTLAAPPAASTSSGATAVPQVTATATAVG